MRGRLAMFDQELAREEREAIYRVLRDAVPDFKNPKMDRVKERRAVHFRI
jgi:hypothetical protein